MYSYTLGGTLGGTTSPFHKRKNHHSGRPRHINIHIVYPTEKTQGYCQGLCYSGKTNSCKFCTDPTKWTMSSAREKWHIVWNIIFGELVSSPGYLTYQLLQPQPDGEGGNVGETALMLRQHCSTPAKACFANISALLHASSWQCVINSFPATKTKNNTMWAVMWEILNLTSTRPNSHLLSQNLGIDYYSPILPTLSWVHQLSFDMTVVLFGNIEDTAQTFTESAC